MGFPALWIFQVTSPCSGSQNTFSDQGGGLYFSDSGHFTQVVIAWNGTRWSAVANVPRGACSPSRTFLSVGTDAQDPLGLYYGDDGNGTPDSAYGEASLSE